MIKQEIREKEESKEKFPVIKKYTSKYGSFLVLFIGNTSGTVIQSNNKYRGVGCYSDKWIDCDAWEDFRGELIIKQNC